jgi:hypothetical protein
MRKLFTNAFQFVFNYMGLKFHHIIYSDIILVLKVNTPLLNEQSACCPTKYSNDLILQWVRPTITDFNTR